MMNKNSYTLPLEFEHNVLSFQTGEKVERIFLLLHGYLLEGRVVLDKFKDCFPINSLIIAPNGPFPVPVKKKEKFLIKYAWYFFDPLIQNYYINFEPAAGFLSQLLKKYPTLPTTVIGYSQGGYLAPKVAEVISQVDAVIGLCCTFRSNRFGQRDIPYYQINSALDEIVDIENSKKEYAKLVDPKGEFIVMENAVHRIGEEHISSLSKLLKKLYC